MLWCILYLCCLLLAGYAVVALLPNHRSRIETFALSLCLGPGMIGLCLIFLSMLGQRPARGQILLFTAPFAAAALFRLTRKRVSPALSVSPNTTFFKSWTVVCLLLIAYGLLTVATDALIYPATEWDAFAIWQLKAKVLALWPLYPIPSYFQNVSLSYSHLGYPILLPMISAGADAMMGVLDDLAKAPNLLFYVGLGVAVYAAIRRLRGRFPALTAAALLMNVYPMYRYAGSGTAEIALTAFYGASILCLLRWQDQRQWGDLILLALFSACMPWTKNEGIPLAAINVLLVLTMTPGPWRRALLAAAILCAIIALLYAPWLFYVRALPRTDEDYAARLTLHAILQNLPRVPQILHGLGRQFVNFNNWGILWLALPALTLLRPRLLLSRPVLTVWILLLLHLLAYIPPYMVTNWNVNELLDVTTDRLLLHAAPPAAILIGLLLPAWRSNQSRF